MSRPPPENDIQIVRQQFVEDVSRGFEQAIRSGLQLLEHVSPPTGSIAQDAAHQAHVQLKQHWPLWLQEMRAQWAVVLQSFNRPLDESGEAFDLDFHVQTEDAEAFQLAVARMHRSLDAELPHDFSELQIRVLQVEGGPSLLPNDPFNPQCVAKVCVSAWKACNLTLPAWDYCAGLFQDGFRQLLARTGQHANAALISRGVLPKIDLRPLIRRTPPRGNPLTPQAIAENGQNGYVDTQPTEDVPLADRAMRIRLASELASTNALGLSQPLSISPKLHPPASAPSPAGASPLPGQVKTKAHEMVQQLVAILHDRVGFEPTRSEGRHTTRMSLVQTDAVDTLLRIPDMATPSEAVALLKERSAAIKQRVSSKQEKATTEIVALMFQSILTEEGLSTKIRLLIARLQMPVMRVAMQNLEFFNSVDHPARKLIDRMGTCVLGMDPLSSQYAHTENEIARIVQMIEQFPEVGLKVFEVGLAELDQFIRVQLNEHDLNQKVATFAQQIEQRGAYSVRYTLEMRQLLREFNIDPYIEEFLLKHWADVLAACTVRHGSQSPATTAAKETASRMVWAAGPKPASTDRIKLMTELPSLLHRIREGLRLLAWKSGVVEEHVRKIAHALGSSLVRHAEPISEARLAQMRERLQHLEAHFPEGPLGDLSFNPEEIELLLEIDGLDVHIINDVPQQPVDESRQWAESLDTGGWYTIQYRNGTVRAQYAWQSGLKQLHLFVCAGQKDILITHRSLAAYLQTGLIRPIDEESLSMRATRQTLSQLSDDPGMLLK
jgi:hypothetical protein